MKIILISLLISLSCLAEYKVSVFLGKEADAKYKADMDYPFGIEFDSKGNMYVVEYDGSCVDVLSDKGEFTKLGGDGSRNFAVENGPIKNAKFNGLHNVIIDAEDNVYVTDTFNNVLRRYDPKTGTISNFVGGKVGFSGDGGQAKSSAWNQLYCAAWNTDKSKIYIADLKNNRVRCVDFKTGIV
ncbi:MAG: hypothetical protein MK132_25075 [Lentisphaerales bacterium]|nr:hypothetical protein [Lentisphaerales bacterium]